MNSHKSIFRTSFVIIRIKGGAVQKSNVDIIVTTIIKDDGKNIKIINNLLYRTERASNFPKEYAYN